MLGSYTFRRRDLQLPGISIALCEGLVVHLQCQRLTCVECWLLDANDLHLVTLVRMDHDELLPHRDTKLFCCGDIDENLAGALRSLALDDLAGLAHGLVGLVIGAHVGSAPGGLEGFCFIVRHNDRLGAFDVNVAHLGVLGELTSQLLVQLWARVLLAHRSVHAGEAVGDRGIKRVRKRVGEHEGTSDERGAQHHRKERQRKSQFMRDDIAQGDLAHSVVFCH